MTSRFLPCDLGDFSDLESSINWVGETGIVVAAFAGELGEGDAEARNARFVRAALEFYWILLQPKGVILDLRALVFLRARGLLDALDEFAAQERRGLGSRGPVIILATSSDCRVLEARNRGARSLCETLERALELATRPTSLRFEAKLETVPPCSPMRIEAGRLVWPSVQDRVLSRVRTLPGSEGIAIALRQPDGSIDELVFPQVSLFRVDKLTEGKTLAAILVRALTEISEDALEATLRAHGLDRDLPQLLAESAQNGSAQRFLVQIEANDGLNGMIVCAGFSATAQ